MKRIYLLLLLCVMNFAVSAQFFQPGSTATFTGAATYCKDATPAPLVFTFNTCSGGAVPPAGVPCTITWYFNPFNSTSTVGATMMSSSGFLCPTSVTGSQSFTPSTGAVGNYYYFCVINWTGGSPGCPGGVGGSITSAGTQLVSVNTPLSGITPGVTGSADSVCLGSTLALFNSLSGGSWSSGNGSIATVGPSSGVVTGVSTGATVISYALGGCITTRFVSVRDTPMAIIPDTIPVICQATAITLSDPSSGGTWSSSGAGVAFVVNPSSGLVFGINAGVEIITYRFTVSQCYTTRAVSVNPNPAPITGALGICTGGSTTLSDISTPGNWSSTSGIASIGSATGIVTAGSSPGTAIITYKFTTSSCFATAVVSVNAAPLPISPSIGTVCVGSTFSFTDPSPGGTWSSSGTTVATVTPTGTVTGINSGFVNILYTIAGCAPQFVPLSVNALPGPITGIFTACNGATTSLFDVTPSGRWYSSDVTHANIDSLSGILTGVSMGTVTITYKGPSGCKVFATITVNPLAPILGSDTICVGTNTALTNIVGGGTWASSNPANASINSTSGIVTGLVDGITFIVYTLPTTCSTTFFMRILPPLPAIAGSLELCSGSAATLSDLATGGIWGTDNAFIAEINPTTGAMNGHFPGNTAVTYSIYGCVANAIVTVDPLPNPVVSFTSSTHALSTDNFYVSYQWFDSISATSSWQPIPGAVSNIYVVPAGSMYYRVLVTDTNGCMNSSAYSNPLAVNNVEASEINVYPNPSAAKVYIQSPVSLNATITSIEGKILITKEHADILDISDLPKGIYLMSLTDNTGQVITVKKLMKE